MSVSPITNALPAVSSRERGTQKAGAPPPAELRLPGASPSEQKPAEVASAAAQSQVRDAVQQANRHFQEQSLNLQYSMDDDTKEMVIKLVDAASGEVIRQIPSEEMLAIARALDRAMSSHSGFAIQTKA